MVETRTYVETTMVIISMASLGINITQEDAADNIYSCDIETIDDMYCFKFSKINDLGIQRNCYYNKESPRKYKICITGWNKTTLEEALSNDNKVLSNLNQWFCIPQGCESIE